MTITKQKPGQPWQDEAGNTIPFNMISAKDKLNEKVVFAVAKNALKVHDGLKALKAFISEAVAKAVQAFHEDYKGKKTVFKGNYTITNFDQSIKVIVSVSSPIKFDDMSIQQAKALLDDFLNDGISAKNKFIKTMVLSAFETSRGQMDVKKILALRKYADKITDERYAEAMKFIDQAIRRPHTATYYNVEVRDTDGKYKNIALALADV